MKYKILIADDSHEDIEHLNSLLSDYFNAKNILPSDYEITKAYTINDTEEILKRTNFNIFFVDINFSEADKTAGNRTGFALVRQAFKTSPLIFVYIYSRDADSKVSYQNETTNLLKQGLLQDVFKKELFFEKSQFYERLKNTWSHIELNKYLWSIWENHKKIIDKLNKLFENGEISEQGKAEIKTNLDSILFLLKNVPSDFEKTLFNLCIILYHKCLEIICERNKTKENIIYDALANRETAERILKEENLISNSKSFLGDWDQKSISAIIKILAYPNSEIFKFGYIANRWRNEIVHNEFSTGTSNIMFYNITLSLYAELDKIDISNFTPNEKDHEIAKKSLSAILIHIQARGLPKPHQSLRKIIDQAHNKKEA